MTTALADLKIEMIHTPLDSLQVTFNKDPLECRSRWELDRNTRMVLPDGRSAEVSNRFWDSWSSLFNVGRSVLDYWSHTEAFQRMSAKRPHKVRVALETTKTPDGDDRLTLLSCTNPAKPAVAVDSVRRLTDKYKGEAVAYSGGIVQSQFPLNHGGSGVTIAGDQFAARYLMQFPIDGYGLPSAYLAMLRQVCANGAIAMSKAFKTQFKLGKDDKDMDEVLDRTMSSFNNEEGYHALKVRLEAAAGSWASFGEAAELHKRMYHALVNDGVLPDQVHQVMRGFDNICHDPLSLYAFTTRNEVSKRKARTIPIEATVYDLLNYASEVATHKLTQRHNRDKVSSWVGDTVTNEYDLEGTVGTHPQFRTFFANKN